MARGTLAAQLRHRRRCGLRTQRYAGRAGHAGRRAALRSPRPIRWAVAAQMALPNWVRARGMSIYQMSIMGATAVGAALWGKVAALLQRAHEPGIGCTSPGCGLMTLVQRLVSYRHGEEDLSASRAFQAPQADSPPDAGLRLVVSIEYFIDPARAAEFRAVMQESRRARLRQGALSWELQHDIADPAPLRGARGRRILDRAPAALRPRHRLRRGAARPAAYAFHVGDAPPVVSRYVVEGE